jgi:hypothetical protein
VRGLSLLRLAELRLISRRLILLLGLTVGRGQAVRLVLLARPRTGRELARLTALPLAVGATQAARSRADRRLARLSVGARPA